MDTLPVLKEDFGTPYQLILFYSYPVPRGVLTNISMKHYWVGATCISDSNWSLITSFAIVIVHVQQIC